MNYYYELEKARLEFRMIFNEEPESYFIDDINYMTLVTYYGKYTGDITKSIELADVHVKIGDMARLVGLSEQEISSLIMGVSNNYIQFG